MYNATDKLLSDLDFITKMKICAPSQSYFNLFPFFTTLNNLRQISLDVSSAFERQDFEYLMTQVGPLRKGIFC